MTDDRAIGTVLVGRYRLAALALAAGGLFGVTWALVGKSGARIDREAFALLATTRGSLLAHTMKGLSVVVPTLVVLVTLAVTVLLARKREWIAGAAIVAGSFLTFVAAHLVKNAQQRPRPHGEIIHAGGFSFPSTDAALSVVLVAIAVAIGRLSRDSARRGQLVASSVVLVALTGVLLIAVRVHYLTDVLGGWGLGTAVFAGCGLAACALERVLREGASADSSTSLP